MQPKNQFTHNKSSFTRITKVRNICLAVFLIWVWPLLVLKLNSHNLLGILEWTTQRWNHAKHMKNFIKNISMLGSLCIWRGSDPTSCAGFYTLLRAAPLNTMWLAEQCYIQTSWLLDDKVGGQKSVLWNVSPLLGQPPPPLCGLRNATQPLAFLRFLS